MSPFLAIVKQILCDYPSFRSFFLFFPRVAGTAKEVREKSKPTLPSSRPDAVPSMTSSLTRSGPFQTLAKTARATATGGRAARPAALGMLPSVPSVRDGTHGLVVSCPIREVPADHSRERTSLLTTLRLGLACERGRNKKPLGLG